ncbi:DNA adenine methylase, partial [Klebsiella pneumoniae]
KSRRKNCWRPGYYSPISCSNMAMLWLIYEGILQHLASVLEHRSSEGHPVIVSNSDTSLIRSLYRNFTHHYIKAKRSIGVSAGESKSATEIIAVSGARCWVGFAPSRGVDSSAVYEVRV